MRVPPPIDLHAHIDAAIEPGELRQLGVVFAATRSLEEAERVLRRADEQTVWGVGCHPGLVGAHKSFDVETFAALIHKTAFVSEVGLDGKSRVPITTQTATLRDVLRILQKNPRITSLHSYAATEETMAALEATPITGAVLHWWLGDEAQTRRALDLGCYFSINAASVRRGDLLDIIPLDHILTETDHPFGDRRGGENARPGLVDAVESTLARRHRLSPTSIRSTMWENLSRLTREVGCSSLLPRGIRVRLAAY